MVNFKETENLEHRGVEWRMMLKEIEREVVECIHLAQNRDKWRAL
jgi:predicted SprT family Zn-dependent metalloprotease